MPSTIRQAPKAHIWQAVLISWGLSSLGFAALLTALLVRVNPSVSTTLGFCILFTCMLWIAALVNGGFSLAVLLVWFLVRRFGGAGSGPKPLVFLIAGLLSANAFWILWNRLSMMHQWLSVRPFITWDGIGQTLLTGLGTAAAWFGLVRLSDRKWRTGLLGIAPAGVLVFIAWQWNLERESGIRTYDLAEVRSAAQASAVGNEAGVQEGPGSVGAAGVQAPRVLLIGIDGMSWSAAVPLMRAGRLPNLARLVRAGSVGYLSNGEESLSPRIWTSIYTGHKVARHGISDFIKLRLAESDTTIRELLTMSPTLDTFYGLRHLVQKAPSLGLWRVTPVGSSDRRVAALWDVASFYGLEVVVVNPMAGLPAPTVNGAFVDLGVADPSAKAYHPPELARRWGRAPVTGRVDTDATFRENRQRLAEEVSFTLELLEESDVALGIYYTHFLDTVQHFNWDFWARDRFLLTDAPQDLSSAEWDTFVEKWIRDRIFQAYMAVDEEIGRFVAARPQDCVFVVSDHGWTYSGFEHFNSPDGVVVIAGPGLPRNATLDRASIEDIAPTVVSLLGLPLSDEFDGVVLESIATPSSKRVASYSVVSSSRAAPQQDVNLSPEELERLKAIGYIDE